jgi:hypothetical protein
VSRASFIPRASTSVPPAAPVVGFDADRLRSGKPTQQAQVNRGNPC